MEVIQGKKNTGKGQSVSSPEQFMVTKISSLSDRDFLANIGILYENKESHQFSEKIKSYYENIFDNFERIQTEI